jgi:hypothetical protein
MFIRFKNYMSKSYKYYGLLALALWVRCKRLLLLGFTSEEICDNGLYASS